MTRHVRTMTIASVVMLMGLAPRLPAAEPAVDLSGYRADSGVTARHERGVLRVSWPMENNEAGRLVLDFRDGPAPDRFDGNQRADSRKGTCRDRESSIR